MQSEENGGTKKPSRAGGWLRQRPWAIGLTLFVIALLIRMVGIDWGLPNASHHWSRHPDEPVVFAYSQQIKPAELKFAPGFYNYGTLYLTLLKVSTDMVNAYGGGPKQNDPASIAPAMANYHRAGRIINALAGAGTCWVVFAILRRRTNLFGAAFGGAAVAIAPGLVIHSRFQTVDVLAVFLLTLGLHYALLLIPDESPPENPLKAAAISGTFIGLSAGTKYTGLLGLLVLAVACVPGRLLKPFLTGVAACLVAFLVSTPGMVQEPDKFWRDFRYEMAHTSTGHGLVFAGTGPGFIYHIVNLMIGFGLILTLLGGIGLGRAIAKKHVWALALGVFALVTYVLIGRAEVKFLRYTFPLIPVLAAGAGWIVGRAHQHPNSKMRMVGFLGVLGLGGVMGGGALTTVHATSVMHYSNNDPRQASLTLFEDGKGLGAGTIGLVSDPWFYTPDFYPEAGSPRWVPFEQRDAQMLASPYKLIRAVSDDPNARQNWDLRLFDQRPDYIVYSSFETEGLERMSELGNAPEEFKGQVQQYESFMKRLVEEYRLTSADLANPWVVVHDLMYIRPTIWVWKRKASSQTPSSGSSTTSSTSEEPAPTR